LRPQKRNNMDTTKLPQGKKIILFDGVCNLCDSFVQYVIKRDKKDQFRFAALQSELGQEILQHIGVDTASIDSIVLYEPGRAYYVKSDAALQIGKGLSGVSWTASILSVFPRGLRNWGYDFVARNRYKWYGKKDQCMIPTPELKAKFL
jgi:predicted DCC family thiol-disulfide oxidoreductase YuxK